MEDKTADLFSGWETYPHNLSFSALDIDANRCHTKLGRESEKLFLFDGGESELQVLQADPKAAIPEQSILSSSEQLLSYLGKPTTTRLFRIAQEHSWSQLLITEELFRKLMTALKVHPGFLDVVHVFGEKITASEESFTAFFSHLSPKPSNLPGCDYEIAYNIKYVARHMRNSLKDPFSIRETGVYHNYQIEPAKSTWILLNAPDTLGERLADAFADSKTSELLGQLRCHTLILLCLSENWRDYVNYLEANFSDLMDRGFSSSLQHPVREGAITVDFADIRSLQIMTDKLKRLIHTLKLNRKLCAHLKTFSNHVKSLQSPQVARSFCQNEAIMDNYVFQNETQISQLESLVDRAQGVGFLIEHILDLRNAETNHNMNLAMHDISKQGVEENSLVRELTSQTTQDTKAMRTIAFISAIFLPATFLATFFGSNFFGFEDTKDGHSLTVASNIWIYVVTALAFSVVAVAIWYWWGSRRGSEPDKVNNVDMP